MPDVRDLEAAIALGWEPDFPTSDSISTILSKDETPITATIIRHYKVSPYGYERTLCGILPNNVSLDLPGKPLTSFEPCTACLQRIADMRRLTK